MVYIFFAYTILIIDLSEPSEDLRLEPDLIIDLLEPPEYIHQEPYLVIDQPELPGERILPPEAGPYPPRAPESA